jgi:xanthine dehydrogenase YagS FAD-binding subunit
VKVFDYQRAESVEAAVAAARQPETAFYAGGTNLIDLMKAGIRQPETLVDISRIEALRCLETLEDGSVRIGALVRNSDLANDVSFARDFPAVAEALLSGASPQLRNAATIGGNLMQQTRCRYFYDRHSACNLHEAGHGCDALDGENSAHAVLGWTRSCIAVHPSDFCVPLAALGAVIEVQGPEGHRGILIDDLYALPDEKDPPRATLQQGELITALILPSQAKSFSGNARYIKLRDRTSYAFAIVSAAAMLQIGDGKITDARLALGGVAAKPWRSRKAETVLNGAEADDATFQKAAGAALADATPSGDNAHKIELAKRVLVRALKEAAAGTPSRVSALPGSVFAETGEGS